MAAEDLIPESFKRHSYHPSAFVYAWKRTNLERLFEELMQSNVAILSGEVWLIEDDRIEEIIPLASGQMDLYNWECVRGEGEEWFDFVERSAKEANKLIEVWNLEKNVRVDLAAKIYYHFNLAEAPI